MGECLKVGSIGENVGKCGEMLHIRMILWEERVV